MLEAKAKGGNNRSIELLENPALSPCCNLEYTITTCTYIPSIFWNFDRSRCVVQGERNSHQPTQDIWLTGQISGSIILLRLRMSSWEMGAGWVFFFLPASLLAYYFLTGYKISRRRRQNFCLSCTLTFNTTTSYCCYSAYTYKPTVCSHI